MTGPFPLTWHGIRDGSNMRNGILAIGILLSVPGCASNPSDRFPHLKEGASWTRWKEGTSLTLRTTIQRGEGQAVQSEEQTYVPAKVGESSFTLKYAYGTRNPPQIYLQGEIQHWPYGQFVWFPAVRRCSSTCVGRFCHREFLGNDRIVVEGDAFSCSIWREWEGIDSGDVEVKTWVIEGLPWPLRRTWVQPFGMEFGMRVVRLREDVCVAGRLVPCLRVESEGNTGGSRTIEWWSPNVPGGLVRRIREEAPPGREKLRVVTEVAAFEARR